MVLLGCWPRALPALSLCLCLVVLACVVECQDSEVPTAAPSLQPGLASSPWSRIKEKVGGFIRPMVKKTRESWPWFQVPASLQGFVQTYYEDHLKDLGPRSKAWIQRSKDSLLNKAHSLCPRLLCGDRDED